jgi:hypothetical protein
LLRLLFGAPAQVACVLLGVGGALALLSLPPARGGVLLLLLALPLAWALWRGYRTQAWLLAYGVRACGRLAGVVSAGGADTQGYFVFHVDGRGYAVWNPTAQPPKSWSDYQPREDDSLVVRIESARLRAGESARAVRVEIPPEALADAPASDVLHDPADPLHAIALDGWPGGARMLSDGTLLDADPDGSRRALVLPLAMAGLLLVAFALRMGPH